MSYTPQFDFQHSLIGLIGRERLTARFKKFEENIRKNEELLKHLQDRELEATKG